MATLREQCKQRLKIAFDSIRAISGSPTLILVVDDAALKVISSTIKMMELINYGVNSIERLELKRKKFNKIDAVYMIHPDSYARMLDDYNGQAQYGSVHVLSLSKIPIDVMSQMSANTQFAKRVKTLKQLNFSFVLHSENEFLVEKAGQNYSKGTVVGDGTEIQKIVANTSDILSTVVTSLSEFYIVEILYSPGTFSNLAQKIAIDLKQQLEKKFELFGKYNIQNYTNSAPQTTILILDRNYDAITPLMRDFHYLPLLYELNDCYKHRIEGSGKDKKVYVMDENEPIFGKYKNQHISRTLNGITADFEAFSREHVGAKMEKDQQGEMGMDKMAEVMKKIPQYTELKDKYSFHMTMAAKIMDNYEKKKYRFSGQLEQNLACQVTQSGKGFKSGDLFNQVVKVIGMLESEYEKVRVLLIALLTLELKAKQKSALEDMLRSCKNYADSYHNIQKLTGPMLYKMGPKKAAKQDLILERHVPKIEEAVKKISEGGQADLKYLRVGTQVRGKTAAKSTLAPLGRKKIGVGSEKTNKPRLIVFFCTAISYNQIRALSNFEKDYQIFYGSHSFTTQSQFLSLVNSFQADQL